MNTADNQRQRFLRDAGGRQNGGGCGFRIRVGQSFWQSGIRSSRGGEERRTDHGKDSPTKLDHEGYGGKWRNRIGGRHVRNNTGRVGFI